ncbi:hypothetical protein A3Q56_03693 [Intoshia linei]|uniref:Uncharacterized protein n=1 Tax=Intoshia linei TaxID=1819745 RepID=A0A177B2Z0_9BILA|nr:hypothetical protein A3Q56_03693 [Intoshia linei]
MSKMYKNSWKGFTRESFVYWKSFIKLIIPGILMIALEFFIFEIGVITAGIIGPTELDTQSIIVQFNAIWYQLPVGVEISTAILIGQHVGSGDKKSSINLIKTSFVFISIISLVAGIALVLLRHSLSGLFTNDARVMMLIGEILPIISFYIFFDGINTVCKGILYGTGRQYIAVVLMFVIYYFIGLPISLIVMFKTHFGINGFWFALGCIIILISIFMTNSVIKTNWNDMIAQAAYRNNLSIHYDYTYENEGILIYLTYDESIKLVRGIIFKYKVF